MNLGWNNLMWWQTSECAEDLARANWNVTEWIAIFWLGWSQIAESTDTWLWQSAPCLVAYPIVSVASAQTWQLHIFVESRSVEMDVKSLLSCWRAGRFIRILQSRRRPVIQYNVACKCLQLSSVVFGCTRPLYTGSMPMQMPQHAYVEWKGCLRSSFPRLGAYASNRMWWQTSECAEDLARANWNVTEWIAIFWLGWSQIAESTDTWLWQSAPCLVAYPIVSVASAQTWQLHIFVESRSVESRVLCWTVMYLANHGNSLEYITLVIQKKRCSADLSECTPLNPWHLY